MRQQTKIKNGLPEGGWLREKEDAGWREEQVRMDMEGGSGVPPALSYLGENWEKKVKYLQLVQGKVLNGLYSWAVKTDCKVLQKYSRLCLILRL